MKTKKLIIIIASAVLTVGLTTGILAATGVFSSGNGGGIQGPLTAEQVYAQAQDLGFEGSLEDFLALCKGEKGDPGQDGKDGQDGEDGENGKDGSTITSIEKTATADNVDTYTIPLSAGQSYTFTVTNGIDGKDGQNGEDGKDGVDGEDGADGKDGVDGKDGEDGEDGADGKDGEDGATITSIKKTSSSGYVDTYTITLSDGQSYTFTVTNGIDGKDGKDGKDGQNGANGTNGTNGENGKTVEFRVDGTWVQWKYTDEAEADWKNLYETTGTPAPDGLVRLSFTLDGGAMPTGTPDHIDVTSGIYVTLPTPTKSGYTFTGWYLSGGTKPLTSPYRVHESQRLYARWEAGAIITGKKIYNIDDLLAVNDNLGGTYVLMNDINCDGNAITIGTDESNAFRGIFEGQGHKIYNYKHTSSQYCGLFGYNTGTIRNLKVDSFDFTIANASSFSIIYVGGLVGYNAGNVQKCSATNGNINVYLSISANCGLLVGESKGTVENCYSEGYARATITERRDTYVAGIVGYNNGAITNCYSIATVYSYATGGNTYYKHGHASIIAGRNGSGSATITNCLAFGTVLEGNAGRGDICCLNSGTITNCYRDENLVLSATHTYATAMSKAQLSSATFYRISLKWDATVWNYSNINFDNGIYPTLIYNF